MKTDKWLVHDAHMRYKLKIRGLTMQHCVKQDSSVYPALLLLNHFIFELLCAKLRGGHTELLRNCAHCCSVSGPFAVFINYSRPHTSMQAGNKRIHSKIILQAVNNPEISSSASALEQNWGTTGGKENFFTENAHYWALSEVKKNLASLMLQNFTEHSCRPISAQEFYQFL